MTRLFVAIDLPEEVKEELLKIQKKLSTNAAKISWAYKKQFHLTLKFIGEVKEDKFNDIIARLEKIDFKEFNLCLEKIGFFPDLRKGDLKVIWVSISPEKKVMELQQKVDEELLDIFSSEQKFQSHITLGRVKLIKKPKEFIDNAKQVSINPLCFDVKNFSLYKSTKVGGAHIYTILKKF